MRTRDATGFRPETLTVSHGYDPASAMGAAKPPLYLTSTYVYPSAQAAKDVHRAFFDGDGPQAGAEGTYIYSRLGHPNLDMLERRLSALDNSQDAAGFCSGMAAVATILMAHLHPGDSVLQSLPMYSGADALLNSVFERFGARAFAFNDGLDEAAIKAVAVRALATGPLRLIWIESPANPTGALVDIALVGSIADAVAKRQGFRPILAVDNTFLGPLLQSPLTIGADLCMTSLTKYCGGHSDLIAGGVSGRHELIAPLKALRTLLGNHMDPHTAWLLLRSLETLHVRTERACANAAAIAGFLETHPKVGGVVFTGLAKAGAPQRELMDRQSRGAGSTFSFHIRGGEAEAFRFLDALKLLRLAVSLGGTETLICHSASTTHYAVAAERLADSGVNAGTLRLSVGIEHVDDLIDDLAQALETV